LREFAAHGFQLFPYDRSAVKTRAFRPPRKMIIPSCYFFNNIVPEDFLSFFCAVLSENSRFFGHAALAGAKHFYSPAIW
jgi:hypothetical protein